MSINQSFDQTRAGATATISDQAEVLATLFQTIRQLSKEAYVQSVAERGLLAARRLHAEALRDEAPGTEYRG